MPQLPTLPKLDWHETLLPMLARAQPAISVVYSDRLVAPAQANSPSASKPRYAVESWRRLNLPLRFIDPEPATREELALAHDRGFIDRILDLSSDNGFENRDPGVAASLPFTTGAMIAAGREAIQAGSVAVAPVSGFHHATYDQARWFCTFNGLVVTAQVLRHSGLARRGGILDADHHCGDGTDAIISRLGLDWIDHCTIGQFYSHAYQSNAFFAALPRFLEAMAGCDLILYQAGADPHISDPLGGWLTSYQLRQRDRIVFEAAARMQIPIAWNLAGGYQDPLRRVLRIHDATMLECARVFVGAHVVSAASSRGTAP